MTQIGDHGKVKRRAKNAAMECLFQTKETSLFSCVVYLALYCGDCKMITGETKRNSWIHDDVVAYVILIESKDLPDSQKPAFQNTVRF